MERKSSGKRAIVVAAAAACTAGVVMPVFWMVSRGHPGPLPPPASVKTGGGEQRRLTVTGHGSASVPPDEALVTLGIRVTAASAREASAQGNAAMQRILAAVKAQGIEERQIRTSWFNISPEYHHDEHGQPQPVRYTVTNAVNVTITDLSRVGTMLDAVIESGGDSVMVQGVNLLARHADEAEARARSAAMANARAKAEQLAHDAGVALGDVLSIAEEAIGGPVGIRHARMAAASFESTPIQAGELEVSAALEVVWALT